MAPPSRCGGLLSAAERWLICRASCATQPVVDRVWMSQRGQTPLGHPHPITRLTHANAGTSIPPEPPRGAPTPRRRTDTPRPHWSAQTRRPRRRIGASRAY